MSGPPSWPEWEWRHGMADEGAESGNTGIPTTSSLAIFVGRAAKTNEETPRRRFFASVPTMANKYGQSGRYERLPADQNAHNREGRQADPCLEWTAAMGNPTNRETGPCRFAAARTNKKMGRHPYRYRPIWQRGESTLELIQELMLTRCLRQPSTTSGSIRP